MPVGSPERRAILDGLNKTAATRGTPQEIHDVREMEGLIGPIEFESEGDENIYFTDGYGKRYFFKYDGRERDAKRIRRYFQASAGSPERKAILDGLGKTAVARYNYKGQLMTLAELVRNAVGKDVFVDPRGKLNYNIVMDKSGDEAIVFKVSPVEWRRLRLPDLTPPNTREKVLDARLAELKGKLTQMSDRVEFNTWAKQTGASKVETIEWLERRL
jgi:hypothetical protein